MYNGVPTSLTGAWISFCVCTDFRAFRFTRRCLGDYPGRFVSWAAPAWAGVGSRGSGFRRTGRQHRKAAQFGGPVKPTQAPGQRQRESAQRQFPEHAPPMIGRLSG